MTSDRVEWVLRQVEKWNSGDVEGFLDSIPPEFEFTPDPSFPDAGTYRGEQVRDWIRDWFQTWRENRLEVLQMTDLGSAVLMESRWHLSAPQSGEAIPVSDFNVVFWFDRDDRPTRMAAFFNRDRAVEAAAEGTG
ncbi:MAG: nuclear transport factor 2 family protein [Solirubrobacterales bacterium]